MQFIGCLAALTAFTATSTAVAQPAPAANPTQAQDARPLLWNGLRAGMSPREVYDALRRQRISARLARDPVNGREIVETPNPTTWAGRPYLIAIGFVENRLFYVEINSHRMIPRRVRFDNSHFSQVARLLTDQYGQPVEISPQPLVSDVAELGANTGASGRFERDGVRADLRGSNGYATFRSDVSESVTVRFWRISDAERFARSQAAKPPAQP